MRRITASETCCTWLVAGRKHSMGKQTKVEFLPNLLCYWWSPVTQILSHNSYTFKFPFCGNQQLKKWKLDLAIIKKTDVYVFISSPLNLVPVD